MQLFAPVANKSLLLYRRIIQRIRCVLHAMGVDVLDPQSYRPGWRLVIMYLDIWSFLFLQAYTVYRQRAQPALILQCICTVGVPLRGCISTTALWLGAARFLRLSQACERLHRQASGRSAAVLLRWTQRFWRLFAWIAGMYGSAGVAIVTFPLVYYALYGERVLMLSVLVPGVDTAADMRAYVAVTLYEILCSYLSVGILLGVDSLFVLMTLMACAYVQVVRVQCEQLARRLAADDDDTGDGECGPEAGGRLLRNAIVAGQRADAFVRSLCECFEAICGVQLALAGFSLALCMLAGRVTQFVMAYPLAVAMWYQMFSYAAVGSALEVQNDGVALALAAVRWDRLAVADRRLLVVMVLKWQRPRVVTVMGSVRLNVATAMQVRVILRPVLRCCVRISGG